MFPTCQNQFETAIIPKRIGIEETREINIAIPYDLSQLEYPIDHK
jgi:hypothetical protein